jgi:hypothetical protein
VVHGLHIILLGREWIRSVNLLSDFGDRGYYVPIPLVIEDDEENSLGEKGVELNDDGEYDNVDCCSSSDSLVDDDASLDGDAFLDDDASLEDDASLDDDAFLDDDVSLDDGASFDDAALLDDELSLDGEGSLDDNASSGDEMSLGVGSPSTEETTASREGEEDSVVHSQDCIGQQGLLEVYIGSPKAEHDPEGKQSKPRQERVSTPVVPRPCL